MMDGIGFRRAFDLAAGWPGARRLAARDRWSHEALLVHQRAAFAAMVRHAAAASPFYAQHYRGLDLAGEIDPTHLPITNKRLLMENLDQAVTDPRLTRPVLDRHLAEARGDGMLFGTYRVVASAGTSGLRGIFVYDRAAWRVVLANTLRWQAFAGISPRLTHRVRICSIGADNPMMSPAASR